MSIHWQVLGEPGRDNALYVRVDTGHSLDRLLFDCGAGCVSSLPFSEILAIDQVFFSHLHMDHVGGFDELFRAIFDRQTKPNILWGPPQSAAILQHRFRGYLWNVSDVADVAWLVKEVHEDRIHTWRFELQEGFAVAHDEGSAAYQTIVFEAPTYAVECYTMDHLTPSLAYIVREKPRRNVDSARLAEMGLSPGAWLQDVKEGHGEGTLTLQGRTFSLGDLREKLLVETPGESIAYLTDFLLNNQAHDRLLGPLAHCHTMVCECQYREADRSLAWKNYHMTTAGVARLAADAQVRDLVVIHVSDRYTDAERHDLLAETRRIFPRTRFAEHWK